MTTPSQFYLEQVRVCAESAAQAVLDNQRDTFLRAGAAWQALADRAIKQQAARAQRDADAAN